LQYKKESDSDSNSSMVTLIETMWNPSVADIYQIKGITTVLYTNSAHITS
jgi:hypothetical protein